MKQIQSGFTLIEMLVVLAVIGLLAAVITVSMGSAREKAKIARAKADVRQLVTAAALLASDTGRWPGGCPAETWSNPELLLDDDAWSGLFVAPQVGVNPRMYTSGYWDNVCEWTAEDVSRWRGPYAKSLKDPWNRSYVMDYDFCNEQGQGVVAILSLGPNGSLEYKSNCPLNNAFAPYFPAGTGGPNSDDIVGYPPIKGGIPYLTP